MEYLNQDCALTLEEGLNELYSENPIIESTSRRRGKLFRDHDLAHVVFGCDTSITGEQSLEPWVMLGTTISMSELKEYAFDDEVVEMNKVWTDSMGGKFIAILKSILLLPKYLYLWLFHVRRMHKKWPHSNVTVEMMRTRISELRREYGIVLFAQSSIKP